MPSLGRPPPPGPDPGLAPPGPGPGLAPPGPGPGLGHPPPPRDLGSVDLRVSLSRVAQDAGAISLVDLDGEDRSSPGENRRLASDGASIPVPETGRAPAGDEALELDLARAGLTSKPHGQSAPARALAPVAATPPAPAERPAQPAGSSHAASPAPAPERTRLLGDDAGLAGLIATAIGLVLGLVVASEVARRAERDEVTPLHVELKEAVNRPLAARAGEIRTASAVRGSLDQVHADVRSSFLLTWLVCALPVAGGLYLFRRPG